MGLFGIDLFKKRKGPDDSELYDFAKHGLLRSVEHIGVADIDLMAISGDDEISERYVAGVNDNNKKAAERAKKKKKDLTPKEVYNLATLNDDTYTLNTDAEYIAKNVRSLEKKRALLPQPKKKKKGSGPFGELVSESYGASKFGYEEMTSLIERLENRKYYKDLKDFFEQYPYTRSDLVNDVLTAHQNLRAKRVEEFIPDLPDDAIDAMTSYNKVVQDMCGKNAVFYIIADKKDFGEVDKKRDPILLAQSPFSLAWQILGAWDEEMIYLGDL